MQVYSEKNRCCGCTACYHICPVQAISMEEDAEGFLYPVIDEEKCIKCNRCKQVCAFQSGYPSDAESQLCYGARAKEEEIVKISSSGGMFYVFAKQILEQGGIVFGARYNEELEVEHVETKSLQEISQFMGSKYAQSSLNEVFRKVERYLHEGKNVLFSGTPCQNAGLNNFLQKKGIETQKLWTIDIVCHGVNSPRILRDYLRLGEEAFEEKIANINMRDKRYGWNAQKASFVNADGKINPITEKYPYNKLYLSLLGVRESCYNCVFTNMNRPADVTLADFWNIPANSALADDKGVSTVILNTEKGKEWFQNIKDAVVYEEYSMEQIWQPHLEFSSAKPAGREKFWKEYEEKGSHFVISKYSRGTFLSNVIKAMTPILKKMGLYQFSAKVYKKVFK